MFIIAKQDYCVIANIIKVTYKEILNSISFNYSKKINKF